MSIKEFTPPTFEKWCQLDSLKSLVLLAVILITANNVFVQAHFKTIDGLRYLIDKNAKAVTLNLKRCEKSSLKQIDKSRYLFFGNCCPKNHFGTLSAVVLHIISLKNPCFYRHNDAKSTFMHSVPYIDCFSSEYKNFSNNYIATTLSRFFYDFVYYPIYYKNQCKEYYTMHWIYN